MNEQTEDASAAGLGLLLAASITITSFLTGWAGNRLFQTVPVCASPAIQKKQERTSPALQRAAGYDLNTPASNVAVAQSQDAALMERPFRHAGVND